MSSKLHVKAAYIVLVFEVLMLICLIVGFCSSLLSGLVGFLYPCYMSFKALETNYSDDDRHWLTYWTVYSFVVLADPLLEIVLSFIPMYHFFKVINKTL